MIGLKANVQVGFLKQMGPKHPLLCPALMDSLAFSSAMALSHGQYTNISHDGVYDQ